MQYGNIQPWLLAQRTLDLCLSPALVAAPGHLELPHHQSGISKNRPPIPQRGQLYFMSRIANGLCIAREKEKGGKKAMHFSFLLSNKLQTCSLARINTVHTVCHSCWNTQQTQPGFASTHYRTYRSLLLCLIGNIHSLKRGNRKQFVVSRICSASGGGNVFAYWNSIRTRPYVQ